MDVINSTVPPSIKFTGKEVFVDRPYDPSGYDADGKRNMSVWAKGKGKASKAKEQNDVDTSDSDPDSGDCDFMIFLGAIGGMVSRNGTYAY